MNASKENARRAKEALREWKASNADDMREILWEVAHA